MVLSWASTELILRILVREGVANIHGFSGFAREDLKFCIYTEIEPYT